MKRNSLVVLLLVAATVAVAEQIVPLSTLDLNMVEQDSGRARANRSVDNKPMSIAGETFTNGFGTHAFSQLILDVHGNAERFSALAGIDDEIA